MQHIKQGIIFNYLDFARMKNGNGDILAYLLCAFSLNVNRIYENVTSNLILFVDLVAGILSMLIIIVIVYVVLQLLVL